MKKFLIFIVSFIFIFSFFFVQTKTKNVNAMTFQSYSGNNFFIPYDYMLFSTSGSRVLASPVSNSSGFLNFRVSNIQVVSNTTSLSGTYGLNFAINISGANQRFKLLDISSSTSSQATFINFSNYRETSGTTYSYFVSIDNNYISFYLIPYSVASSNYIIEVDIVDDGFLSRHNNDTVKFNNIRFNSSRLATSNSFYNFDYTYFNSIRYEAVDDISNFYVDFKFFRRDSSRSFTSALFALDSFDSIFSLGFSSGYSDGQSAGYTNGYSVGLLDGYENGYLNGLSVGREYGYTEGYDTGYLDGTRDGFADGYSEGEIDGYNDGYDNGYTAGVGVQTLGGTFSTIIETPFNIVSDALDFNFPLSVNSQGEVIKSYNLKNLIGVVLAILILVIILKLILGRK